MGEGDFTGDTLETFGGYGVMQIKNLNSLMAHICLYGYEHHVAVNIMKGAAPIEEALKNYLGWEIYCH